MRDWQSYKERYLHDPLPIRLGGLAANLARINSFSDHDGHFDLVRNMIEDSEYLVEWAAPDATLETQAELVELQIQLAVWHLKWQTIWSDVERRRAVAAHAGTWSERVLELSGLLNET